MHPLHDYVAKQLAEKIKARGVVVWYDERSEFQPFVEELRGGPRSASESVAVTIAGAAAHLAEYAGSMFELRMTVEPRVCGDAPDPLVLYLPGVAHDRQASVLMELEEAGTTWKPQLKHLARNVLLQKYTLGVVDDLLPQDRKVSYADLAQAAAGQAGAEAPSILKSIFPDASGSDGLITAWLVNDARDPDIVSQQATRELARLVKARLGLDLLADAPLAKLRAITLRYVLAGEFRLDLSCDAPATLGSVATPPTRAEESAVREIARRLRTSHPEAYAELADRVEEELGLGHTKLPAGALGAIDTFRFEERALLLHAGELIAGSRFDEALALVADREQSFWLDRNIERKAQWEATRRMAELGRIAVEVRKAVQQMTGDAAAWFEAYVSKDGWFRLDLAQRRLEAWVANLDSEPEERPLGVVRRAYEDACHAMADGFHRALVKAGWNVPGTLHQTGIWSELVATRPTPVAYFLVDAMRFEMGVELAKRLPKSSEVAVRAAVAALPSITPIGMAALQPGAAASFSVVEQGGKLGSRIDEAFLPDLGARKKHAAARVPKLVDLALDELLSLQASKLAKKVDGAQVVVVRSQEIDHAGETGFTYQARQVMDTVIDNLARALRKLASAGIEHAVVSADHGHLFFATDRDPSMRTDAPGGHTVELHRRCWIGRGGATPSGCVRVAASMLGYASDLEFVFPVATGVFRAGGDLAFHHGGTSLQEMAIPVLTVRTPSTTIRHVPMNAVQVSGAPVEITNRVVTFQVASLFGATITPTLLAAGCKVGSLLGVVGDGEADRAAGTARITAGGTATVALVIHEPPPAAVAIVLLDAASDAELYRSPSDIPVRLGV
jgi:hypothetical protein